jgi:hypothetical protein
MYNPNIHGDDHPTSHLATGAPPRQRRGEAREYLGITKILPHLELLALWLLSGYSHPYPIPALASSLGRGRVLVVSGGYFVSLVTPYLILIINQ